MTFLFSKIKVQTVWRILVIGLIFLGFLKLASVFNGPSLPGVEASQKVQTNTVSLTALEGMELFCGANATGSVEYVLDEHYRIGLVAVPELLAGSEVNIQANGDLDACVDFTQASFAYDPEKDLLTAILPLPIANRPRVDANDLVIDQSSGFMTSVTDLFIDSSSVTEVALLTAQEELLVELSPEAIKLAKSTTEKFLTNFANEAGIANTEIAWDRR